PFLANTVFSSADCRREHADNLHVQPQPRTGSERGTEWYWSLIYGSNQPGRGLRASGQPSETWCRELRHLRTTDRSQQTPLLERIGVRGTAGRKLADELGCEHVIRGSGQRIRPAHVVWHSR